MPAIYTLEAHPSDPLLGEPVTILLRCEATGDAPGTLTLDHRSLVVELDRPDLPEPLLAFPNRRTVENGGRLVRLSTSGGVEDLSHGEERVRSLDLDPLFGAQFLAVGRCTINYRLEDAEPPASSAAVEVDVMSGPDAFLVLLERLDSSDLSVRTRSGELLSMMTAQDFGYDAGGPPIARRSAISLWRDWWMQEGQHLPWSFESEGATFGRAPLPAPMLGRSRHLGGVAFPGQRP